MAGTSKNAGMHSAAIRGQRQLAGFSNVHKSPRIPESWEKTPDTTQAGSIAGRMSQALIGTGQCGPASRHPVVKMSTSQPASVTARNHAARRKRSGCDSPERDNNIAANEGPQMPAISTSSLACARMSGMSTTHESAYARPRYSQAFFICVPTLDGEVGSRPTAQSKKWRPCLTKRERQRPELRDLNERGSQPESPLRRRRSKLVPRRANQRGAKRLGSAAGTPPPFPARSADAAQMDRAGESSRKTGSLRAAEPAFNALLRMPDFLYEPCAARLPCGSAPF